MQDRSGAAWLLGGLGATDWVDGWVARRFNQESTFGAVFDPAVDRSLFIIAIIATLIDNSVPNWFGIAVLVRELAVSGALLVATAFGMQRFAVSIWGKRYTFLLMFGVPLILLGADNGAGAIWVTTAGWIFAVPALVMSYTTAFAYAPKIRHQLRVGRALRHG